MLSVEQTFPTRVAGVVRTDDADVAFQACMAVIEAGIATVEVTMTVPSCMEIVRGLVASTGGGTPIGVGNRLGPGRGARRQVGRRRLRRHSGSCYQRWLRSAPGRTSSACSGP